MKGLVEQPTTFAGNELVLAVPADSDEVASLEDLSKDGVTIAIGQDVTVGSYTRTVLDKFPAGQSEAILANVRSEEPDVAGASLASSRRARSCPSPTCVRPTAGRAAARRATVSARPSPAGPRRPRARARPSAPAPKRGP
jgi:hypothetical protein